MWWLWLGVAFGADPDVHVTWRGDDARLHVRSPDGEHVAPDAPFDLDLSVGDRRVMVAGFGEDVDGGVPLGDVRGRALEGRVGLSLCEDGGTRCRILDLDVRGLAEARRKGSAVLTVTPHSAEEGAGEGGFQPQVDAAAVWSTAVAEASEADQPILLDFGAVWCPPCNLLDVEVLHAAPAPSVVGAYVLAQVDVDDPTSWELKDRYDVGGYPTMVAVEADGTEVGRLVGYPGVEATVAWMDDVLTGRLDRSAADPGPREAADRAWAFVKQERPERAREALALAVGEPERVPFRLARMRLEPNAEDAAWLAERAPGHALDWVPTVPDALMDDPVVAAAVRRAVEVDLAVAEPLAAADLLYVAADREEDGTAALMYGAAAALVRSELTGDLVQDKGHLGWLAKLLEYAGRVGEALALLEDARQAFPDEPTFHSYAARAHLRQGQAPEALGAAERAYETAWGDNKLTAAMLVVRALLADGRRDEAQAFVDEVLAAIPAPPAEVDVRAHRYRARLKDLVDDDG